MIILPKLAQEEEAFKVKKNKGYFRKEIEGMFYSKIWLLM